MVEQSASTSLEELWERLLSRETEEVQAAFSALTKDEQTAILAHLRRMAQEPDWHAEQRISAQFALSSISDA